MIHTCKSLYGLSLTRRFAKGKLDVCVGNGAKVASIAVDSFHLPLPSGLVLEGNNYYCIPTLCKNIISSLYLEEVDGYEIIIKNKRCSIYYNGIFMLIVHWGMDYMFLILRISLSVILM
jgi:hypothetical protein